MLDIYAFATPNSIKAVIAAEELELDYQLHAINVRKGEQREPDFLALNANGKVPVLVESIPDQPPFVLTESAAILIYLAEREGRLLPASGVARARVFEQLLFHASGLSPAFGQAGFFKRQAAEPQPLAIERFSNEAQRTLGMLDLALASRTYAAGDEYSIADIAHFGWLWRREFAGIDFQQTPHVARWYDAMAQRPAVQRAMERVNALIPSV